MSRQHCISCGKLIGPMDLYYVFAGGQACLACTLDPKTRKALESNALRRRARGQAQDAPSDRVLPVRPVSAMTPKG